MQHLLESVAAPERGLRRRLKLAFDREVAGSPFGLGTGTTPADTA